MGFFRRTEIGFYPEVDLYISTGEPAAPAFRKYGRFGELGHAQHIAIEATRGRLLALRHGELDVIERGEWITHETSLTQTSPDQI
jgi:hypothetical protein